MKTIAVFTGTRAEYGLLFWLMKEIQASDCFDLQVIAAAMHLSPEYGTTYKQIEQDGFAISAKIEMLLSSDTSVGTCKSMGLGIIGFADALERLKPDALIVLGDRFEAMAISQCALVLQIPIAHIHGGELTEGAYDDAFRHSITKMASVHFTAAETYRKRVIQMGEHPSTVYTVGALGLDHLIRGKMMSAEDLSSSLNFSLGERYFVVTYHPVTAGDEDPEAAATAIVDALDHFSEYKILLTRPNADNGGHRISAVFEALVKKQPNRTLLVTSLGFERYLSAMSRASAVIGNSSSGIIETPAFGVPTVNVGIRQQGRLAADSVLHAKANSKDIQQAIERAIDPEFAQTSRSACNPYGQGDAAKKIIAVLTKQSLPKTKRFCDLD